MIVWLAVARVAFCIIVLAICWGADRAINSHASGWRGNFLLLLAGGTTGAIWAIIHG